MNKILIILFSIIFCSCQEEVIVKDIGLSNGIYSPVNYRNGFACLVNVEDYFNKPAVAISSDFENFDNLYLIETYRESITQKPFYSLLNSNSILCLIYKKDVGHVVIENIVTRSNIIKHNFKNNNYGSVFCIESKSVYIKSGKNYEIDNFSGYKYSFYNLSKDLDVISQTNLSLGELKPFGIAYLNENVFYYKANNILYLMNIKEKNEVALYKFDGEVIESETFDNKYYIMANDSVFIFDNSGGIIKGLKFKQETSEYIAEKFWVSKDFISITLRYNKSYKLKVLSKNGAQVDEIKLSAWDLSGGQYALKNNGQNYVLYSKDRYLHIKKF